MTMTHLAEWWFNKMHLGLAGLLHFVRNDGNGVVNYGSINNMHAVREN